MGKDETSTAPPWIAAGGGVDALASGTEGSQTPTFILSSGRSGSTLVARLVREHPELLCISDLFEPVGEEPYFDSSSELSGREFFALLSRPSYPQRIAYWRQRPTAELLYLPDEDDQVSLLLSYTLPFLAGKEAPELLAEVRQAVSAFPPASPADQLVRFFDWLRDRHGKRLWVERTGGSLPHTRVILETWPDARIVHNFRDPRETAISMMHGSFFRLYLELEKNPALDEWDWRVYPPIEEMGAMLDRWMVDALDALSAVPAERKLDLAFEDLQARPEETLLELVGFLLERDEPTGADLAWARAQAGRVRRLPRKFPRLEAGERRRLEEACRESIVRLGYRLDG